MSAARSIASFSAGTPEQRAFIKNQAWGLKQMVSSLTEMAPPPVVHHAPTQAANLDRRPTRQRCRTIAVCGGKGGVGKTTVAVNLGMTLAMMGRETMLLDADMGLANVDVLLGLAPSRHLGHMLDGQCGLSDLVLEAPHGLKVIPAGSGARRLAQLGSGEQAAVIRAFDELPQVPDFLLVDTAAGISDAVAMFAAAADDVVLVVCDEPASITDAYAMAKVLSRDFGVKRLHMVANMVRNLGEARALHQKLARVTDRFLDVMLDFMGWVPQDERLRQAIRRQNAVVDVAPGSRSAQAFKQLAGAAVTWAEPDRPGRDRIAFFSGQAAPATGW